MLNKMEPNSDTGRAPDFICIGAQKAGTSWLRVNLSGHPGIWMPPKGELHYFDRLLPEPDFPASQALQRLSDQNALTKALKSFQSVVKASNPVEIAWWAMHNFMDTDDDWYRMQFSLAPDNCIVGEITPRYAICDDVAVKHMYSLSPNAKLIFILREPVERFWSQCKMKMKKNTLAEGDSPAMHFFDSFNGRRRGEYSKTLLRYTEHYDPSQMLIVFYDAIKKTPSHVVEQVIQFLGLPAFQMDETLTSKRVNAASDERPMPSSLKARIAAAYRSEIEILAETFGGYANQWLEGESSVTHPATIQLTPEHIEFLSTQPERIKKKRKRHPLKVFCLSMQRSGTTSVGDWLEFHGLRRAGSPTSVRLKWTKLWNEGDYDSIFASTEFQNAEILEDDPWWCPGFYNTLKEVFPEALFVLLTRDSNDWFTSLCHHSAGMNPGSTVLHARIYDREEDLRKLKESNPHLDPTKGRLLSIKEHRQHYIRCYETHTQNVLAAFEDTPERLFHARLEDPSCFEDLCDFIGVQRNPDIAIPRSNYTTDKMRQALENNLQEA